MMEVEGDSIDDPKKLVFKVKEPAAATPEVVAATPEVVVEERPERLAADTGNQTGDSEKSTSSSSKSQKIKKIAEP